VELSFSFSLKIIELYKILKINKEYVFADQILRSGTSIGANIAEAQAAQTKKDFIAKMSIAAKEARENRYWLMLLDKSRLVDLNFEEYLNDVLALIRILTSIIKTSNPREF